ncbi:MAG TPA: flagellar biosynthesis anti-sigma factor FlgM [Polyangiaceae bacterium]|jgi:flagellar biosynthesis anti-sigma factor FlgM|nr:flagellar biosynthesis anti-sigma factor FlgM [Polyangiaceae bacterium]
MKGINGNPALDAYQRVAVTSVNATRPVAKPSEGDAQALPSEHAAKVSISNTARELVGSKSSHGAERVQELKQKIEDGTFQVNPQMIASRMMDALG